MKKLICLVLACTLVFCCAGTALALGDILTLDALLTFGEVDGSTYKNATLGYGCTLEGWNFATAEDIASINGLSKILLSEDVQDYLANTSIFIDMLASTENGMSNINIGIERIDAVYGTSVSIDEIVHQNMATLQNFVTQMGYTDPVLEKVTVLIDGTEHLGLALSGKCMGLPVYQKVAFVPCGDYLIMITASSFVKDRSDEIFASFFAL